jgi:hypothetical protein
VGRYIVLVTTRLSTEPVFFILTALVDSLRHARGSAPWTLAFAVVASSVLMLRIVTPLDYARLAPSRSVWSKPVRLRRLAYRW